MSARRSGLARAWLLLALVGALLAPAGAGAHELVPGQLGALGFEQQVGAQVPLDLSFRDEAGRPVLLGSYFGARPVLLTLNYLRCPNLCPLVLEGLARGLRGVPFALGDEYEVVTVSIDPRDGPALARGVRLRALHAYGQPESGAWRVLTGRHAEVDRLAEAVGFRYAYDPDQDEYAHPAGAVVLTPGGRVSRYLYGIDVAPTDLRLALVEAGQHRLGSVVDRALLLCYQYEAERGRYTPVILSALRWFGAATVLGLGAFIWWLVRTEPRRRRERSPGGA